MAKEIGVSTATLYNLEKGLVSRADNKTREKITNWIFEVSAEEMPFNFRKKPIPDTVLQI